MGLTNTYKRLTYSKRVIVNLHSGKAFRGYLSSAKGSVIILKQAELIEPGAEVVSVQGEVLIERSNIDFVQIIGG